MSEPLTMDSLLESMKKLQAGLSPSQPFPFLHPRPVLLAFDPYLPTVQRPRKHSRPERLRCWLEDLVDGAELAREVFPWRRVVRTEVVPAPYAYLFDGHILLHSAHAALIRTVCE